MLAIPHTSANSLAGYTLCQPNSLLIWHTGAQAGIYATAEIIEQPKMLEKQLDINYWPDKSRLGSKPQTVVRFTKKLLETPVLRENLKQHPILKSLIVICQPNSTNYKVAAQEWQQIHEIINSAI